MKPNISVAIVGHIDHGKSTFIGRLLYDMGYLKKYEIATLQQTANEEQLEFANLLDIYKEEREHAMTMDTTKRYFETARYHCTIIDTPGHKEFIKNMLSGVSEAHIAIAVVSCAEKIQEQTKRHLSVLKLLGIPLITVAVNKMDLAHYDKRAFTSLVDQLKDFLAYLGQDPSVTSFIPIVAKTGENISTPSNNMPWYQGLTLVEHLDSARMPQERSSLPLRIVVQHIASGTSVVFGKIETGKLRESDEVIFEPSHVRGKITDITVLGKKVTEASAGETIALAVHSDHLSRVKRGDVCGDMFNVPKSCQYTLVEVILPFDLTVRVGETLAFRSGAAETEVVIIEILQKFNSKNLSVATENPLLLREGEIGILKLALKDSVVLEKYSEFKELGRFLLIKGKKAFPGIILQTGQKPASKQEFKFVCSVSPSTIPHLNQLVKQKRVAMLRVNGAFKLPDFQNIRSYNLPLMLDIPGDRKKIKTSELSDDELIQTAIEEHLDYIALSYVRSDDWIKKVRDYIANKNSTLKIIAKIETKEAIEHLEDIVRVSDMILIDRGDLGSEIGFEKVPFYQEKIIAIAKKYGKQVLIATEIVFSTIHNDRPTYAEVEHIYQLVKQNVNYIVLAEETARSDNPIRPIEILNRILDFAEAYVTYGMEV